MNLVVTKNVELNDRGKLIPACTWLDLGVSTLILSESFRNESRLPKVLRVVLLDVRNFAVVFLRKRKCCYTPPWNLNYKDRWSKIALRSDLLLCSGGYKSTAL